MNNIHPFIHSFILSVSQKINIEHLLWGRHWVKQMWFTAVMQFTDSGWWHDNIVGVTNMEPGSKHGSRGSWRGWSGEAPAVTMPQRAVETGWASVRPPGDQNVTSRSRNAARRYSETRGCVEKWGAGRCPVWLSYTFQNEKVIKHKMRKGTKSRMRRPDGSWGTYDESAVSPSRGPDLGTYWL